MIGGLVQAERSTRPDASSVGNADGNALPTKEKGGALSRQDKLQNQAWGPEHWFDRGGDWSDDRRPESGHGEYDDVASVLAGGEASEADGLAGDQFEAGTHPHLPAGLDVDVERVAHKA